LYRLLCRYDFVQSGAILYPLTERERWLTSQIMDIAIGIHRFLGPGLLESVYEKCFYYELTKRNIPYLKQKCIELIYDNLIIDDLIIIELKAQEVYHPVWEAQLLSYLKLTQKRLGYILNFHVPLMKDGVKRMIL